MIVCRLCAHNFKRLLCVSGLNLSLMFAEMLNAIGRVFGCLLKGLRVVAALFSP